MNYKDFNDNIELSDELYEKTMLNVKAGISKHNQIQKRKKSAFLSFAACFIILISSFAIFDKRTNISNLESTPNMQNTQTTISDNKAIKIETDNDKSQTKIIIDKKIYTQYIFNKETQIKGEENKAIEIKKSDIGELICDIKISNITNDLTDFSSMDIAEAESNTFYKAKAYKFSKSQNDNVIIVVAKNKYYLFYLNGITTDYTSNDLIELYTSNGNIEIESIEIWQNELFENTIDSSEKIVYTDERPVKIATIKDKTVIKSIMDIISKDHNRCDDKTVNECLSDYEKGLSEKPELMSDNGEYELRIIFSDDKNFGIDESILRISVYKKFFNFQICEKGNTSCFSLSNNDYKKLTELFKSDKNY
ncbi:MAG: hypothetical protein PUE08_03340 [Eubacteriales bacterium]|nr:hypothetical protein [Eubacteriales bacterium]